jgi:Mg2+ and Co2+ transporter CorA
MTVMARATENSGDEVAAMTGCMENDAPLMKFLSEITDFFLPITAVATVFSMDFSSPSQAGCVDQSRVLEIFNIHGYASPLLA